MKITDSKARVFVFIGLCFSFTLLCVDGISSHGGLYLAGSASNGIQNPSEAWGGSWSNLSLESSSESHYSSDIGNLTELENFLDNYIPDQLDQHQITGMTLSFVKNDNLLLAKGYGNRITVPVEKPVMANQTLFRIGSVSKTFTAVAVLQLVEDGILDLDTDINEFLTDFQIPDTYNKPITLRHLLTHTAGFEEKAYPSILISSIGIPSLENLVIEILPDRVHPPGTITSYSNYAYTLAGYIVEEMSGRPFEEYIEEEIFLPIGMNSSTFKQPLPTSEMYSNMSTGYYGVGSPGFFEYITVVPAGSCSSTATDMAKFMIALLDNGFYNGTQILLNDTVQMMQEEHFTTHENLPGVNLGLYEMDTHDIHIIGHGGDTIFFHSLMALFPDEDLGFFVSYNSQKGSIARNEFFQELLNQFFPYTNEIIPMENYDRNLRQYEGLYLTTRRYYSDKIIDTTIINYVSFEIIEHDYLKEAWRITTTSDGFLNLSGLEFVQVEPDYFVEATGQYDYKIAFIRNDRGHITNFYTTIIGPIISFELLHPIYTIPEVLNSILLIVSTEFLVVSVIWGILSISRGIGRITKEKEQSKEQSKKSIFPIVSKWLTFSVLVFSIIPFIFVITGSYSSILLAEHAFGQLEGLFILPILTLILIASMIVFSVLSWLGIGNANKKPYWKLWERILYSINTALSLVFVAFFMCWNLLGY